MRRGLLLTSLLVGLLTVIVLASQLNLTWMLIDDGENLRMGQEIGRHFSEGDYTWILSYEKVNGRFRPAYWLWHFANFRAFGFSSFGHHLGHLILYVLITFLIYLITRKIARSNLAGFLAVLFFLFFYPAAENFYRLGTAEPPLLLFYLLVVFLVVRLYFSKLRLKKPILKKKDYLSLSLALGFAYFMKETTPILIPAFLPLFIIGFLDPEIKNKKSWLNFSLSLFFLNLLFFFLTFGLKSFYGIGGGYTEAYQFSLGETISRFLVYLRMIFREYRWVLVIPALTFGFSLLGKLKESRGRINKFLTSLPALTLWQMVLLFWFLVFLAIQSPWLYVMGRYLPPVIVWLAIFMAIEYRKIFSPKEKFSFKFSDFGFSFEIPILKIVAVFLILGLVNGQGKKIRLMYQSALQNERYTQNLIEYLAEKVPPGGSVYVNFSEGIMEYLYELPLHFKFFYSRPDIKVDYLYLEEENTFNEGDFIIAFKEEVRRYPWQEVKEAFVNKRELDYYKFGPFWSVLVFEEKEVFDKIDN